MPGKDSRMGSMTTMLGRHFERSEKSFSSVFSKGGEREDHEVEGQEDYFLEAGSKHV